MFNNQLTDCNHIFWLTSIIPYINASWQTVACWCLLEIWLCFTAYAFRTGVDCKCHKFLYWPSSFRLDVTGLLRFSLKFIVNSRPCSLLQSSTSEFFVFGPAFICFYATVNFVTSWKLKKGQPTCFACHWYEEMDGDYLTCPVEYAAHLIKLIVSVSNQIWCQWPHI